MNKPFLEKLAKNLKRLRKERKLTQDDIGVNGVSRAMISLIELAKTDVTVTKLKIIADNLGIEVKDLFDFNHQQNIDEIKKELINAINSGDDKLRLIYQIYKAVY